MAYSYTEAYRAFRGQQAQLVGFLQRANQELSGINMPNQVEALAALEKKVRSDAFKIQVTGTFKNGKSTFINAFLGEEVLPAYALPCTAVINEVRYGKEKKAVLYFRNPIPAQLPEEIPGQILAHMRKHGMKNVPPVVIPYNQIEKYVVIPMGKDPSQMLLESPYEKVVLYWPLPLLSQGVQIIDSPGLNEHATRTRVTMDYLSQADAILFVLSAQALCAKEEMTFLENSLAAQGFHDPIFVVNRFDCIPEREKPAIVRFAHQKLEKYTSYGSKGIFFTSALNALEAKKARDSAKLKGSGMAQLELALAEYLIKNKGRVKLTQPAAQLKQILQAEALERSIPMQKRLLGASLTEVKQRYIDAKPKIELLTKQKEQLQTRLDFQIKEVYQGVYDSSLKYINDMSKFVKAQLDKFEPETKLGAIPTRMKVQAVVREMTEYLASSLEQMQQAWRTGFLNRHIELKANQIFTPALENVRTMLGSLNDIGANVSGGANQTTLQAVVSTDITQMSLGQLASLERSGMKSVSDSLAKNATISASTRLLVGVLGLFSPIILCAVALGTFTFGAKKAESNALQKIKNAIAEQTIREMTAQAPGFAREMAQNVVQSLSAKAQELIAVVDGHIVGMENQMKVIISELEQGKQHVKQRELALDASRENIEKLLKELELWHIKMLQFTE